MLLGVLVVDMALSSRIYFRMAATALPAQESSMKKMFSIAVITAMAAFNLFAADLAGSWKGSMTTQGGETAVTITIRPGAALAGKVQAGEYQAEIENGKVSGDEISFEMKISPGTMMYRGTVSGSEIKFDVTGTQGDKYKLTCTRQSGGK